MRENFVLPLLRALGWDTDDPGEVYPEFNINNSGPDYLLKVDGVSLLAIDVRNSQQDVTEALVLNLLKRCTQNDQVKLYLLTNGRQSILAGGVREKSIFQCEVLWSFSIEDDNDKIVEFLR
ncbi:hypothetical protein [Chloroflexus aggregans]|uniref:hypothetical protein n=1 Tax=Chloroflexus aggregans TaxID=152260 RepID=UPI00059E01C6|nr:hypothetical protein [Chloroflexus aggregans]